MNAKGGLECESTEQRLQEDPSDYPTALIVCLEPFPSAWEVLRVSH